VVRKLDLFREGKPYLAGRRPNLDGQESDLGRGEKSNLKGESDLAGALRLKTFAILAKAVNNTVLVRKNFLIQYISKELLFDSIHFERTFDSILTTRM